MATTNVSDEKQNYFEKIQEPYCSLDIAAAIHGQLTFIAVLNAFLSITAFLGNVLVLVALRKDSSLHPPSKLLLCNLAVTDLCAGLFSEPLYVTLLLTVVNEFWSICRYLVVIGFVISVFLYVFVDSDCNKRGQTSCPVVRVEIQTGCYFEANPFYHNRLLGAFCWLYINEALLQLPYNLKVRSYNYITVSSNLDPLSYKDFPYPSSSSKSSTRPCSTTQPNKSTEHGAIQLHCGCSLR